MNKQRLAKIAGWIGGVLLASSPQFGKYGAIAQAVGGILVGFGVHSASTTSADNPSGQK